MGQTREVKNTATTGPPTRQHHEPDEHGKSRDELFCVAKPSAQLDASQLVIRDVRELPRNETGTGVSRYFETWAESATSRRAWRVSPPDNQAT